MPIRVAYEDDSDDEEASAADMIRVPVYEEIEASEPNLRAQPKKPVLRRPGQPCRWKHRSANGGHRTPPRNGIDNDTSGQSGSAASISNHLPTRLTDDEDSDPDIQYRSDDDPSGGSPWKLSNGHAPLGPRSTNPAIASKVPSSSTESLDEDDDESEAFQSKHRITGCSVRLC